MLKMCIRVILFNKKLLRHSAEFLSIPYCLSNINITRQLRDVSMYQPQETFKIILKYENIFCNHLKTQERLYPSQIVRHYAKSRDKKKGDKGQKKKIQINEDLLLEIVDIKRMREQMQDVIEGLKEDFINQLSLRSSSGSLEGLPITYEGKNYVLQDVGQIVRKNPKTLVINMVSFPQVIPAVLQAISKSGMNLNPQQDGTTLYVPIPKVTKEHRESLSKNAKGLCVKCKNSIRDIQNKFVKVVKNKEKDGLSKDTVFEVSEYILLIASEYNAEVEKILETKQQELFKEC